jgi:hypothetical protein
VRKTLFFETFSAPIIADAEVLFGMADTLFPGIFTHFIWRHQYGQKMQLLKNSEK